MTDSEQSPHVALAMRAIEEYVRHRKTIEPPTELPHELMEKAGAFVCLKKDSQLRGCVGTIEPTQPSVALEIIQNGISAATRDPRFEPVCPDDLAHLECSVDVLLPPEPVKQFSELDPKKYGVIVEFKHHRGLLLPNLDGVDTVEYQVQIACRKAMISPEDPYLMYRFEVKRYY